MQTNTNRIATYFDSNWQRYLTSVANNALNHKEMFSTLDYFLSNLPHKNEITLADLGCGDSSAILNSLKKNTPKRYIGVDAAQGILSQAQFTLAEIACEKQFICADISSVVKQLPEPTDIIFSSYTLHHLSHANKKIFLQDCLEKLAPNGYFIMVDGVLAVNQTREQWLEALRVKLGYTDPNLSQEEIDYLMEHPTKDDFPESIATFAAMAKELGWSKFDIVVDKGIYAYLLFSK